MGDRVYDRMVIEGLTGGRGKEGSEGAKKGSEGAKKGTW